MKKTLITILATVLVCCCVAGATYAWLVDKTDPITNTFTFGDINITLTETKGTATEGGKSFKVMPGATIAKDPTVTVVANSEACWLFVKIDETNNTIGTGDSASKIVSYELISNWTKLEDGVYYMQVSSSTADQLFYVFAGDTTYPTGIVTINDAVTKGDLTSTITNNPPKITITAYAIQQEGFDTAANAWAEAKKLDPTIPK